MIKTETKIRVRYADTDKMGVVYHANYAVYYEVARTEMFREIGLPYAKMEESGVMLPLVDLHCNYRKSAQYDDLLTVVTTVEEMPNVKIRFALTMAVMFAGFRLVMDAPVVASA